MATPTRSEANVQQAVPFFGVSNMEASLHFYIDGLGFEMTNKWTPDGNGRVRWCWLQHGNAAIMLQEYQVSKKPEGKLGLGVRNHLLPMQRCPDHLP
jgi:lactoylglutathione lyase